MAYNILVIGESVIAHSLPYLPYGKAVTIDVSPARLVQGATTKLNLSVQFFMLKMTKLRSLAYWDYTSSRYATKVKEHFAQIVLVWEGELKILLAWV